MKKTLILIGMGIITGTAAVPQLVEADSVVSNSTTKVNYKFKVSTTNKNAAMYTLGSNPTKKIVYKAVHYATNYPATVFWAKEELQIKKAAGTQTYYHIFRLSDGKDFGYIYSGYLGAQRVTNKKSVATKPVFSRKVGNQGLLYTQNGTDKYTVLTSSGKLANYNDYMFDGYPGTISNGSAWQATSKALTSEGSSITQFANYNKINTAEKRSYFFTKNLGNAKTGWINTANLTTNTVVGEITNLSGADTQKIYQRISNVDSATNAFYDSYIGNMTTGFFFTGKHKFVNYTPSTTSNNFVVTKTATIKEADGIKRPYSYVNQLKSDGKIGYTGWTRTENIKLAPANNWMTDNEDVRYTQTLSSEFSNMSANVRQGLVAKINSSADGKNMYYMNGYNYATNPNKYGFALGNATPLSFDETYYVLATATVYKSGVATPYCYVGTAGTTTEGKANYGWVYKGYLNISNQDEYDNEVYVQPQPQVVEKGFDTWNQDGQAINAFAGYKHQGMSGDSTAYMMENTLPNLLLSGAAMSATKNPLRDSYSAPYKSNFMTALESNMPSQTLSGELSTLMYLPYGSYPVSAGGVFSKLVTPQSMTFDSEGNLFIAYNWSSSKTGTDTDNRGTIMRISSRLLDGIRSGKYEDGFNLLNRLSNNTPGARWPLFTGDVQIINVSSLGHAGSLSAIGTDVYYIERFEDGTTLPENLPVNDEGTKLDGPAEMGRLVKVSNDLSEVENLQDFYYLNTSSNSFYNVPGNMAITDDDEGNIQFYQVSPNGAGGYFALNGVYDGDTLSVMRDDVQMQNGVGQTAQGVAYDKQAGRLTIIENGAWQSTPVAVLSGTDYSESAVNQIKYAQLGMLAGTGGSVEYAAGNTAIVQAEFESIAYSANDDMNQYYLKVGYNEIMIGDIR